MRKYENFCKALSNLHEGLKLNEPYSVVEQTGIVGLFEICFEQSWKLMKAVLEDHGRFEDQIGSPRAIIKIAYQCNMIKDGEKWLRTVSNAVVPTYSDAEAVEIIRKLKNDYFGLFEELRDEIDDRWI